MLAHETGTASAPLRTRNLERECTAAFAVMFVLMLTAGGVTLVGITHLGGQYRSSLARLETESTIAASLRADLAAHRDAANQLLTGGAVDRAAFVNRQHAIEREFAGALATFASTTDAATILAAAQRTWQSALTNAGLWDTQVASFTGPRPDLAVGLSASSNATATLLDGLAKPSLNATRTRLERNTQLERELVWALTVVFALAIGSLVFARRRLTDRVVRPIGAVRHGLEKFRSGDYDYRIAVTRRDELGELAEGFNLVAGERAARHNAAPAHTTHDALTGLFNHASLTDRLTDSFAPSTYHDARHESALIVDVDDFKAFNDSIGHGGGDNLLIQIARRLEECVGPNDLVARLGGDEFAIIVVDDEYNSIGSEIAKRILQALRKPFTVDGTRVLVTASIGVAPRIPSTDNAIDLLRRADFAMFMAKDAGKACYRAFDVLVHDEMLSRLALKSDLAAAVSANQIRIDYQPVVDLRTGDIVGVEALARWQHPTFGLLSPGEFIPIAEETGDIDAIGCWVLDTAARQAAIWRETVPRCSKLWVSVNLSAHHLVDRNSLAAIQRIFDDPAIEPDSIVLEVTETALAIDLTGGITSLTALKSRGVRIAIDDFGTGFSSLSTLASLPVDILKIDRSFVSGQVSVLPSVPMLEGILVLAGKLDLSVIAEGIEAPEQLDLLRNLGCEMGQGYLLARPARAVEALLATHALIPASLAS